MCGGNWDAKPKPKGKITWLVNVKLGPKRLTVTSDLVFLTHSSQSCHEGAGTPTVFIPGFDETSGNLPEVDFSKNRVFIIKLFNINLEDSPT